MNLNFFTGLDLTDDQVDAATSAVRAWCEARQVDPSSAIARSAAGLAIDLVATWGEITSAELFEILLARVPANAPNGTFSGK
ncbi:hypothetical protein [Rhizobium sp. Root1220]|uniref:hypothetical protein n=1 Tax=Rhizobium sp. Root1220 TaxID=1736432 RepID=UPI0006FFB879|nr:hypothetical protein [Rhizobium sp. Root1220]KQV78174.1 hypothetical protein ASC90_26990 [Rhizobium sp. Root1220]